MWTDFKACYYSDITSECIIPRSVWVWTAFGGKENKFIIIVTVVLPCFLVKLYWLVYDTSLRIFCYICTQVEGIDFLKKNWGSLVSLFRPSGDISSGFQNQSGRPYSQLAEAYVIYTFPVIHLWCLCQHSSRSLSSAACYTRGRAPSPVNCATSRTRAVITLAITYFLLFSPRVSFLARL